MGPLEALDAARGRLLPWAPVWLSLGIGGYFALPRELPAQVLAGVGIVALLLALIAVAGPRLGRLPAMALALALGGLLLADFRASSVAAPVLSFRYYGPVAGRIVEIDRSQSDLLRLTLDRVVLDDVAPARTPATVRVALHGAPPPIELQPGLTVMMTAHLSPPSGPAEPGGFDFQRLAWFASLGAVGYTRTPVLALLPAEGGLALPAFRLRRMLAQAMEAEIGGQSGAFAAALMTGDRSGILDETNEALRLSNLSHLISISGLHMGLLVGFVFAACRYGLALVPPLALRLNTKKIAAVVALIASALYLGISGGDVATERAFVMAAVMLVAVLCDRRALSLRSVAIAALIVLVLEPESLIEPGFQMSFGATVALIAAFAPWSRVQHRVPKLLRGPTAMVLSSLAAGSATAPIAAVHFNRIAEYGLLANLAAVPIMGILVMPAGVIAAILAPLGLAAPALWIMGQGTALILVIAHYISGLDGAASAVPTPPAGILPMLALGGLSAFVARALWLRAAGGTAVAAALALWVVADRPALLVADDGTMMGRLGPEGRALSKPRGAGFVVESWLENDGDLVDQKAAFARPGLTVMKGGAVAELGGREVYLFSGKGSAGRGADACRAGRLIIVSERWEGPAPQDCTVFDQRRLRETGSLAISGAIGGAAGEVLRVVTARDVSGQRLWNSPPERPERFARAE